METIKKSGVLWYFKQKTGRAVLTSYLSFSLIILSWELIVYLTDASKIVIVKPSEIYPVIFENSDILLEELLFTFEEVVFGWFFGNLIAFVTATLIYRSKELSSILVSISVTINAIPLIALAAILGGMIGTDQTGKTVIVALLCFFPMFISALKGFTSIDRQELNLMRTYAANDIQKYLKLILPSSLPYIANTLKINVIVAIFAAVVSEFFGAHGGIGDLILAEKGLYDLPMVWAAIFYIIIAGSLFYFSIDILNKLIVPWRK
ncbi:ABC transporter permease subunit [Candidatus Dojkabacteria bacterium]|nr:ABC transporter permease subunit [Candidatus Dojkabacteria bacterium]